jgi:hypothetical protein
MNTQRTSSWWIGLSREEFSEQASPAARRMRRQPDSIAFIWIPKSEDRKKRHYDVPDQYRERHDAEKRDGE